MDMIEDKIRGLEDRQQNVTEFYRDIRILCICRIEVLVGWGQSSIEKKMHLFGK